MTQRVLNLIEIEWRGPFTQAEMAELIEPHDRGVLAIYGSHPVFGDDALLYIDEAREGAFAERLSRIEHWLRFLPSKPTFFIGRLGGTDPVDVATWHGAIDVAHRMLVFFHAPPWNSRGVDHHGVSEPTVVLNLGRRHRIQLEVSTLWDQSAWDPARPDWRPFGTGQQKDD